jgi:diguanylate cyclase (GGDEF)-like protein/PAS domain S-box-containing protein
MRLPETVLMTLSDDSYARIIETLHDGLYCVDRNRKIVFWNRAAERISGFSAEEVIGSSCADNILTHVDGAGTSLCQGSCPLSATMADRQARDAEVYLHHKAGHRVPVLVRVTPLIDSAGNVIGGIELFTDLSNRETHELRVKELDKLAMLDALTQLPNRRSLEREIATRIEEQRRYNVPFAVLFLDVDHFKQFNDVYGHAVGDAVLQFIAETMVANARPFDIYGRWGGEEFLAIIRNVGQEEPWKIGERLRSLIESSYLLHDGHRLQVTVSIGGTLVRDGDTVKDVAKRADALMYASKTAGRNRLTVDSDVREPLEQAVQS